MQPEPIIIIIAILTVLVFLGVMFLVAILYFNNKKKRLLLEQQEMKALFEKQILESKLEMQEQTFNFISQEIHDNVGQVLSLAKVQLNIMDQQPEMDRSLLREAKDSISKAMTELRDIAKSLSSERIQSFELGRCITEEINRINRSGLVKAQASINGTSAHVKDHNKLILFRIVQESIQNIIKHAKATEINVIMEDQGNRSVITITDNGSGFDVEKELSKESGLGLKNIIHRAELIGGNASISSKPQQGTSISIIIPHA